MEVIKHNVSTPYVAYAVKIPLKDFKNIDKKKNKTYNTNIDS